MRITIAIPHIYVGGGIRVPLEYANHLQGLGHQVTVVYPRRPPYYSDVRPHWRGWGGLLRRVRYDLRYWTSRVLGRQIPNWFSLMVPLHRVPDLQPPFIPDADIILAVDWTTAEEVNRCNSKKGLKFYLIQGHDVWLAPPDRVEATWRMPLHKIVVSSWLKELVMERSGCPVYGPILNGVNLSQFSIESKRFNHHKRIGMLYHANPVKGVQDGLTAFEMARVFHPDIQLVMFGTRKPKSGLPPDVEFHENPPQHKLRDIYGSCDIWLSPSRVEGFALVPMEAMAGQCAVVATRVGAIEEYTIPGETALVSPPRDPKALAHNLIRLLADEDELKRVAKAGHKHIRQFTWERSARQMENLFEKILQQHASRLVEPIATTRDRSKAPLALTVVIVTWNSSEPLVNCLRALEAERTLIPLELFVVDNASTDGSADVARRITPWAQVVENHDNRGFAAANNQALTSAQGRYVAFLNPDAEILGHALASLVHHLDRMPDAGAVGPMTLTPSGEVDSRCARRFPSLWTEFCEVSGLTRRFPRHRLFSGANTGHWDHRDPQDVDALSGACMVVRREALDQVGLLDESFFMYSEDTELCFRLKQAGWRVVYWPEARIRHWGGYSTSQVRNAMGVEALRSTNHLFRKCYGARPAAVHRLMIAAVTADKLVAFGAGWLAARNASQRTGFARKLALHRQVLRWALGDN